MRPKLLALDEPIEGIRPSISRDIADDYAVMDRGAVVLAGDRKDVVENEVRKRLSV